MATQVEKEVQLGPLRVAVKEQVSYHVVPSGYPIFYPTLG